MMNSEKQIEQVYQIAKERYAELGVDVEKAQKLLAQIPISMHCWQVMMLAGLKPLVRSCPAVVFRRPVIIPAKLKQLTNYNLILKRP